MVMRVDRGLRRHFFRAAARETLVWLEEAVGHRHVRISDLSALPESALLDLIPQVQPGVRIVAGEREVRALLPDAKEAISLFAPDETTLFVFNQFNSETDLRRIAAGLGAARQWPSEQATAYVRGFFLRLLRLGVCVPRNYDDAVRALAASQSHSSAK